MTIQRVTSTVNPDGVIVLTASPATAIDIVNPAVQLADPGLQTVKFLALSWLLGRLIG